LQMIRHRSNIYANITALPWRYDVQMGAATSLHASA